MNEGGGVTLWTLESRFEVCDTEIRMIKPLWFSIKPKNRVRISGLIRCLTVCKHLREGKIDVPRTASMSLVTREAEQTFCIA
jgi:hypothetical protein